MAHAVALALFRRNCAVRERLAIALITFITRIAVIRGGVSASKRFAHVSSHAWRITTASAASQRGSRPMAWIWLKTPPEASGRRPFAITRVIATITRMADRMKRLSPVAPFRSAANHKPSRVGEHAITQPAGYLVRRTHRTEPYALSRGSAYRGVAGFADEARRVFITRAANVVRA